jgi:hypothetical protein
VLVGDAFGQQRLERTEILGGRAELLVIHLIASGTNSCCRLEFF